MKKRKTCGNPGCPVQDLVLQANESTCTILENHETTEGTVFKLSCGHGTLDFVWSVPKYCSECGKRVVSDEQ